MKPPLDRSGWGGKVVGQPRPKPWLKAQVFALMRRLGSGPWRMGVTFFEEVGEASLVKLDLVRVFLASG